MRFVLYKRNNVKLCLFEINLGNYALEKIQAVVSDGDDMFIEMDVDGKRSGAGVGVYVRERYEEVKAKIAEAC